MKERDPRLKVVIASGYLEPGLKARILREGVVGLIRKPYSPNEVLLSVRKGLDQR